MTAVRICPDRDRECGDFERSWCATCPKRAPDTSAAPTDKCRGCNGHGMVGNILDSDVCQFCNGSGAEDVATLPAAPAPITCEHVPYKTTGGPNDDDVIRCRKCGDYLPTRPVQPPPFPSPDIQEAVEEILRCRRVIGSGDNVDHKAALDDLSSALDKAQAWFDGAVAQVVAGQAAGQRELFEDAYARLHRCTPGGGWNDRSSVSGHYEEVDTQDAWILWNAALAARQATDAENWSQYLKDGETPLQRLQREIQDSNGLAGLLAAARQAPVPMTLHCPQCAALHVDDGEWATRPHKTHQCQACKHEWRPFEYATVGVDRQAPTGAAKEPGDWQECERISDLPDVDDALRGFSEDPTADNATCVVRAILASRQVGAPNAEREARTAALDEAALIDWNNDTDERVFVERRVFEAWAMKEGYIGTETNGNYRAAAADCWKAWQAALASLPKEQAP
jgi:hypothetical protein